MTDEESEKAARKVQLEFHAVLQKQEKPVELTLMTLYACDHFCDEETAMRTYEEIKERLRALPCERVRSYLNNEDMDVLRIALGIDEYTQHALGNYDTSMKWEITKYH